MGFFIPSNNFAGSSGYSTGSAYPSVYRYTWDPVRRMVVSNDPATPGLDASGRLKNIVLPSAAAAGGAVNPYAGFNPANMGGFAQVPLPGTGGTVAGGAAGGAVKPQLLSGAGGAGGQGYNPYWTVTNPKSPEINAEITKMLAELNTLRGMDPTGVVTGAMKAAEPAYKQYLGEETGAVGKWFNGDIESALEALRGDRAAAYDGATGRAQDALSRVLALSQMSQGGGASVGTSSYLQKQALDTAANLEVQKELDAATQGRTDLMAMLAGQQANLGTRSGLTTQDIQRQLLPSQVSSGWFNNILAGLGGLANLQLANNFYGLGGGDPAGQVSSVSIPSYGGGGGGGVPMAIPVYNSTPIAPRASYTAQPALSPLDQLRQQILASGQRFAPYGGGVVPRVADATRGNYYDSALPDVPYQLSEAEIMAALGV